MSRDERQINIPALEQSAAQMSAHIETGFWARDVETYDASIVALQSIAEQIPYDELAERHLDIAGQLGSVTARRQAIEAQLEEDRKRLDSMKSTLAQRMNASDEDIEQVIASRRVAAEQAVRPELDQLTAQESLLGSSNSELEAVYEAVGRAWPIRLSVEVTEAQQPVVVAEASTDEAVEKNEAVGPYAELADSIPSLSERLQKMNSMHIHLYDEIVTPRAAYQVAIEKEPADRTQEEQDLVRVVGLLQQRFLKNPNNLKFLEVYTTQDIFNLFKELNKFRKKDRPDFKDLEGRVCDLAGAKMRYRQPDLALDGVKERMESGKTGRRGMQWSTLKRISSQASDKIRSQFFANAGVPGKEQHRQHYIIDIVDRQGTQPELSEIYQFIADDFAYQELGRRMSGSSVKSRKAFIENCDIIKEWLAEIEGKLDQLPEGFRLEITEEHRRRRQTKALFEVQSPANLIKSTASDIEIRKKGNGTKPRHKNYLLDPIGAINHQLRLGHIVEDIKLQLRNYNPGVQGYTEEIESFS